MSTTKLLLASIGCAMLAGCGGGVTFFRSASTPQIAPTIACGEDRSGPDLPDYPRAPAGTPTIAELQTYSDAQTDWSMKAVGTVVTYKILRRATSECLAAKRKAGLIN